MHQKASASFSMDVLVLVVQRPDRINLGVNKNGARLRYSITRVVFLQSWHFL